MAYTIEHNILLLQSRTDRCHALGAARLATTHIESEYKVATLSDMHLLLYGSEIWTLLAEDSRRLQSFHMSCQRQILGVRSNDHVRNSDVAVQTGLPNITETIIKRRHMLFGHVARLDATTPAH